MTPPQRPDPEARLLRVRRERPRRPPGRGHRRLPRLHHQGPRGPGLHRPAVVSTSVDGGQPINQAIQPITITSQVAEVIYFLRNGNLYRRVFLVAPERAKSIIRLRGNVGAGRSSATSIFGGSAQRELAGDERHLVPARRLRRRRHRHCRPIPNDLGDLTNRENRAFRPRFRNDFNGRSTPPTASPTTTTATASPTTTRRSTTTAGPPVHDANGNPVWAPNAHDQRESSATRPPIAGSSRARRTPTTSTPSRSSIPGMYSVARRLDDRRITRRPGLGPSAVHDHGCRPDYSTTRRSTSATACPDVPPAQPDLVGLPDLARDAWPADSAATVPAGPTRSASSIHDRRTQQPLGLRPIPPSVLSADDSANLLPPVTEPGTDRPPVLLRRRPARRSFVAVPAPPPTSPNPSGKTT